MTAFLFYNRSPVLETNYLELLELICPPKQECGSDRVLRSSEACFGRGAPAIYLELELICPPKRECGSERVLRSSEACFGRDASAIYLELELICPPKTGVRF